MSSVTFYTSMSSKAFPTESTEIDDKDTVVSSSQLKEVNCISSQFNSLFLVLFSTLFSSRLVLLLLTELQSLKMGTHISLGMLSIGAFP